MSSVDFRGLRPPSNDPMMQVVVELMKRAAKSTIDNQTAAVDSDNEDIYSDGQDVEAAIKYHSELSFMNKFAFRTDYYPPFEPDASLCRLMLKGWNTGIALPDESTFNHDAAINGDPALIDGTPFDPGITTITGVKSICLRLNRPTSGQVNAEWLEIPSHSDFNVSALATGFSIQITFRLKDIAQQGSVNRTILERTEDSTPNNGFQLMVDSSGRLIFIVTKGGVTTKKQTNTGVIAANTVYEAFLTFNVTGPVIHIYVNNVDQSLTDYGTVTWHGDLTDTDFFIFKKGTGTTGGFCYGDFYTMKYYKEKVCSSAEVGQHFNNKWTIANIAFGKVALVNYFATFQDILGDILTKSFTAASFTTTSFTI